MNQDSLFLFIICVTIGLLFRLHVFCRPKCSWIKMVSADWVFS